MNAPHTEDPDSPAAAYPDPTLAVEEDWTEPSAELDHDVPNGHAAVTEADDDPSFADRAGRHAREAWDQIQMAFPRLMGQPGYWGPRRMFTPTDRPFDPDDLPLEAERSEEERLAAEQLAQATAAGRAEDDEGAGSRGWRSVTRLLRMGDN